MALIQTVHLSMANFKSAPVVPAVQNDTDRQVKMIIDDYTLTSGLTGKIAFERSDGTHYETAAELVLADNAFVADIDQALTQPGRTMVQLKVTDTLTVSTFSFVIFVESDYSGTVTPQEGIDLITAVEAAEDAADRAESAAAEAGGLSNQAKQALLACFANVAWINDDGQDYYDALENALYPVTPVTLVSISAVYTQTGTVYDTDSLDSLKADLVVTGNYDDGTTAVISTGYTLSGTLTAGTSTITASYGGKTDTFDVTVTHNVLPVYSWDFTSSLTDSIAGMTATTQGGSYRDSSGLHFTGSGQSAVLTSSKVNISNRTVIIDIPSGNLSGAPTTHARIFSSSANSDGNTASSSACFCYQQNQGWNVYSGSAWGTKLNSTTYPKTFFNNKRLKLYIDNNLKVTVSYADMNSDSFTTIGTFALAWASTYSSGYLVLGGYNTNDTSPMTISKVEIYEGEA